MKTDRTYFGQDLFGATVSQANSATDTEKLRHHNLPILHTEEDLAEWLHIPLGKLRWFTFDRLDDTVWHYTRYSIPKRNGGSRVILAPKKEIKQLQRVVLWNLLYKTQRRMISDTAHGFVPNRSIITNARHHIGKHVILRMDLEGFFPGILFPRIRDLFIGFGYSTSVASTLALLCTERDREVTVKDGMPHFIALGPRHLVQGAPTSPALANLVAHNLDARLEHLAAKYGLTYTRYADDLTFSGNCLRIPHSFLWLAQEIIGDEEFQLNHKKTTFAHQSSRQVVTGIVVNDEPSTPRALRRRLRAVLHNAKVDGFASQNHDDRPNYEAYLQGLIAFVESANPRQAVPLREAFHQARLTTQSSRVPTAPLSAPFTRRDNNNNTAPATNEPPESTQIDSSYIPVVGDHVVHPKYGRGVVTTIRISGDITVAEVQFLHSKVGMKSLDISLARLRPDTHKA